MKIIFVFGSNLAGRHGKGAARHAAAFYGAKYGVGEGRTGDSYAIPTKDENLKTLPLEKIKRSVEIFSEHAEGSEDCLFLLTPIGTGLAGHPRRHIWAILKEVGMPSNVVLASTWVSP